jgi:hypothetical protein
MDNFKHETNFNEEYSADYIATNLDYSYIDANSLDIPRQIELDRELKELMQPRYSLPL